MPWPAPLSDMLASGSSGQEHKGQANRSTSDTTIVPTGPLATMTTHERRWGCRSKVATSWQCPSLPQNPAAHTKSSGLHGVWCEVVWATPSAAMSAMTWLLPVRTCAAAIATACTQDDTTATCGGRPQPTTPTRALCRALCAPGLLDALEPTLSSVCSSCLSATFSGAGKYCSALRHLDWSQGEGMP